MDILLERAQADCLWIQAHKYHYGICEHQLSVTFFMLSNAYWMFCRRLVSPNDISSLNRISLNDLVWSRIHINTLRAVVSVFLIKPQNGVTRVWEYTADHAPQENIKSCPSAHIYINLKHPKLQTHLSAEKVLPSKQKVIKQPGKHNFRSLSYCMTVSCSPSS